MFGRRFLGGRYFGARYFGDGGVSTAGDYLGKRYAGPRYFGPRYFSTTAGGAGPTYTLTADAGTLTLTGQDAQRDLSMAADAGTLTLTGHDAALTHGYVLAADAGTLTLTGQDADLTYTPASITYTLTADAGTLTLTGQDATFGRTYVLDAESGVLSLPGQDAVLDYSGNPEPPAQSGIDIEFEFEPALWWQRKPKTLGNVKAKAKLAKVAKVIAKKAVEQVEKSAPEAQRKAEVRQAVAPMLPEMPGFDWKPVYEQAYSMALTAAIDAQMRQAEANQEAAREIERIRQLDEEDIAILVAMM